MTKLEIKNIGPIKEICLDIRRVNVIIGPQSSGKSCVLKIASFCAWAEKHFQLEQEQETLKDKSFVNEHLIEFHKLNGYFKDDSSFSYKTNTISINYVHKNGLLQYEFARGKKRWGFNRSKIAYIPSERNIIAMIPSNQLSKLDLGMVNIREFISEWSGVKKDYARDNQYEVLDLGIKYYYDENSDSDKVYVGEKGSPIDFRDASSGIQSSIPMCLYLDYLFDKQYSVKSDDSILTEATNKSILMSIYKRNSGKYQKNIKASSNSSFKYIDNKYKLEFANEKDFAECLDLYNRYVKPQNSDVYLEEPEQNLFPQTQVSFVYDLLSKIQKRKDHVFVATHSPYILYALNNCMLGYIVRNEAPLNADEDYKDIKDSLLNPEEVSVWELRDGSLSVLEEKKGGTIQREDGLISNNYFDRVMKNVIADFTNLSVYYE